MIAVLIGSPTSRACSEISGRGVSAVESSSVAATDGRNQRDFVVVVQLSCCIGVLLVQGQREGVAKSSQLGKAAAPARRRDRSGASRRPARRLLGRGRQCRAASPDRARGLAWVKHIAWKSRQGVHGGIWDEQEELAANRDMKLKDRLDPWRAQTRQANTHPSGFASQPSIGA